MKKLIIAYITLFVGILSIFGILLIILPKQEISQIEQKKLAKFPQFAINTLFSGAYMDSIDIYVAEHFPMRFFFLELADALERNKGLKSEEEAIYTGIEVVDKIVQDNVEERDSIFGDKEQLNNSKGLLISHGQGIQIFTNEKPQITLFTETWRMYRERITHPIRIFNIVTPTAGAYYMPEQYKEYQNKEKENLLALQQKINIMNIFVPVFDTLKAHQKKYIFFRTDHHWTALGAYYAYTAFCQAAGLVPIQLSSMRQKYVEGSFLGTHYLKTRDKSLENNPDTVFYWEMKGEHSASKTKEGVTLQASIIELENIERNKYLVFLGGDEPLMNLRSGFVQNGKKVLLLKNSYGNSFASYLLANYENIWIVDYRYFKGSVSNIINQNKIDDLIFVSGIFAVNEPSHIKKMRKVR